MRIKNSAMAWFMALAMLAIFSMGCVPSLQPLIDDEAATFEPALVGTWVATDDDKWRRLAPGETSTEDRWIVERKGVSVSYEMKSIGEEADAKAQIYSARVAKFSTGLYLELRADADDNVADEIMALHLIGVSTFYRIEIKGDTLQHFILDPDWLEERLESRAVRLPHEKVDGRLVITASTKQLQRFIERHGADPGAFAPLPDGSAGVGPK